MIKLVVNTRDRDDKTASTRLQVTFFDEISINLKYDSVASTYKLQMYFDPDNAEHAELAAVSHIHECSLYYVHDIPGRYMSLSGQFINTTDELIITGFMLSQLFTDSAKPSFIEIGGYSKPGVLGDCDFPTSAYPLESVGLSLRQIINQKVVPYFSNPKQGGFRFLIKSSRADSVFTDDVDGAESMSELKSILATLNTDSDEDLGKTTADESKNILSYLKELAIQKDLVLSHDIFGNLVVNAAYTGNDYLFEIGTERGIRYIDISCNYNGQAIFSQVEAKRQPDKDGGNMAYAIEYNPLCRIVFRPKVITITKGDDNTAKKAALSEIKTQLKSIPLIINLDKPVANGKFIMPNNTIKVLSKKCYLYRPSKWFIEEVNYVRNSKEEKCTVTCVLPGAYGGKIENPFLDHNENFPKNRL